ncbi:7 transmembrane receptor (rhodopsin family)-like protein 5 [Sarcoptes scabiei]|uniref:7 transmembrane receptor (Rhodopsin family)-like protein 5 n=1 Tax=Sarcoptes scabiei TaxID=52283 RepID=A0A131ZYL3_SARSC|nr:7 transmembrane receptor (rhodopsin family)-like protein 5 [Sarcoptes scabiei]
MTRCTINDFPDDRTKQSLTLYTFLTQYLMPIGFTSFFYLHIGIFLWRRESIGSISERRRVFILQRKRKRVRLLIMVVATFAVCWFPLNLYVLLNDFGFVAHHPTHWFAMSSVCYNPFIYCWLNDVFRQKTTSILKCLLWKPIVNCYSCCCLMERGGISNSICFQMSNYPNQPIIIEQGTELDDQYNKLNRFGQSYQISSQWNLEQNNLNVCSCCSSSTGSNNVTGQQQAISELIAMTALLNPSKNDGLNLLNNTTSSSKQKHSNIIASSSITGNNTIQQLDHLNRKHFDKTNRLSSSSYEINEILNSVTKEQRLALMTTQAGRRRYHSGQLIMMFINRAHRQRNQQQQQQQQQQKQKQHQQKKQQHPHPHPYHHHHYYFHNHQKQSEEEQQDNGLDQEPVTKTTSLNLGSLSSCSSSSSSSSSSPSPSSPSPSPTGKIHSAKFSSSEKNIIQKDNYDNNNNNNNNMDRNDDDDGHDSK